MAGRFALYGLRPDRRFLEYHDDLNAAKTEARRVALTKVYSGGAEVWSTEPRRPVYAAWLSGTNRLQERN